jgi:hypothetical protein
MRQLVVAKHNTQRLRPRRLLMSPPPPPHAARSGGHLDAREPDLLVHVDLRARGLADPHHVLDLPGPETAVLGC